MLGQKIDSIESGHAGFIIHMRSSGTPLVATDELIQTTLLAAFSVDADLSLDLFEGTSLVRRVNPFDVNKKAGKDEVSRVATQIDMDAGASVLEIFVVQSDHTEKTFSVRQQVLQRICLTAALKNVGLVLRLEDSEVVGASFPPPRKKKEKKEEEKTRTD